MFPIDLKTPISRMPYAVIVLLVIMVGIFSYHLVQPEFDTFAYIIGVVPKLLIEQTADNWFYVPTSLVVHASFVHLLGNAWFFWLAGRQVEQFYGHLLLVLLFAVSGIISVLTKVALAPGSGLVIIGSAGAISGIMAAYVVIRSADRLCVLVPTLPRLGIRQAQLPGWSLLLYWIGFQAINGLFFVSTINFERVNSLIESILPPFASFLIGLILALVLKPVVIRFDAWLDRLDADQTQGNSAGIRNS